MPKKKKGGGIPRRREYRTRSSVRPKRVLELKNNTEASKKSISLDSMKPAELRAYVVRENLNVKTHIGGPSKRTKENNILVGLPRQNLEKKAKDAFEAVLKTRGNKKKMIMMADDFIRQHHVLLYGIFSSEYMVKNIYYSSMKQVVKLLELQDDEGKAIEGKRAELIKAIPRGMKNKFHWEAPHINAARLQYNPEENVYLNREANVYFTKEDAVAIVEWVHSIYEPLSHRSPVVGLAECASSQAGGDCILPGSARLNRPIVKRKRVRTLKNNTGASKKKKPVRVGVPRMRTYPKPGQEKRGAVKRQMPKKKKERAARRRKGSRHLTRTTGVRRSGEPIE